jgi:diaminopimelate epimerase
MWMKFTKMHGLGNDFVVIDAVTQNINLSAAVVRRIADRHLGIGCDQVLIVEPPSSTDIDFNYRIFNSDGSEVEQCGNGARCLARFVRDRKLSGKESIRVKTMNRIIGLSINKDNTISVDMGIPQFEPKDLPFEAECRSASYEIDLGDQTATIAAISMGNPHAVMFVDDIDSAPVSTIGSKIEKHYRFPNKVNVGFVEVVNRRHVKLRVHERGSGETRACGSGACAAAVATIQKGLVDSPVTVALTGGNLTINWPGEGHSLIMSGQAITSFHGQIKL